MDHGTGTPQTAEAAAVGPPSETPAASHRKVTTTKLRLPASWPLLAVLAVQALLTLRLVGADTAFQDEALYLWGGHLEWAHWLHGIAIPQFPSYFSGAPAVYPPLGAVADSIGGLTGARILSLIFMLGTTALLWDSAGRLFGRRAAFFAAALFAVLGPTLHLGSFATYDAMSLFLVALAATLVIRAAGRREATGWMIAAGVALALANMASYSTGLLDPVLLLLALLTALPEPGGKLAASRCLIMLAVLAVLLTAGLLLGGSSYLHGVQQTTLARVGGSDSPLTIVGHTLQWIGIVFVLAVGGVIASAVSPPGGRDRTVRTWLLALLAAAALPVPFEQAGLHTIASLNKHDDVGAWFAAIAAGYAVDRLIAASQDGRRRYVTGTACVVALIFPVVLGASQGQRFATAWPKSTGFTLLLGQVIARHPGRLLVEDPSLAEYYLPVGRQWTRWSSTRNIVLPNGESTAGPSKAAGIVGSGDPVAFARFIAEGYFSVVALNYSDTTALDHRITAYLKHNPAYHHVLVVPYGEGPPGPAPGTYVIWYYRPKL